MKLLITIQAIAMLLGAFGMVYQIATGFNSFHAEKIGKFGANVFAVCWCLFAAEFVGYLLWQLWN